MIAQREDHSAVTMVGTYTLAASGLSDQMDLLAFASALEAQPAVRRMELVRAEGGAGLFSVEADTREALLAACEAAEGFAVSVDVEEQDPAVLEISIQRVSVPLLPSPSRAAALARLERRPDAAPPPEEVTRSRPRLRIFGRGRQPDHVIEASAPSAPPALPEPFPVPPQYREPVPPPAPPAEWPAPDLREPESPTPAPAPEPAAWAPPAPVSPAEPEAAAWTPPVPEPPLPIPDWSREPSLPAARIAAEPERDLVRADARPGGAAPLREHLVLIAYPFRSFEKVNEFQDQLAGLEGVISLKVGRFYRGALQLKVEYEGIVPLTRRLRDLKEFAPVAMNQPDDQTIEITLEG